MESGDRWLFEPFNATWEGATSATCTTSATCNSSGVASFANLCRTTLEVGALPGSMNFITGDKSGLRLM